VNDWGFAPFVLRIFVLAAIFGGVAVTGPFAELGTFVLEPDFHLAGGPVELVSDLGTDFKGRERVDGEGSAKDGNLLSCGSFAFFVQVLGLYSKVNLGSNTISLNTLQSLGGLKGLVEVSFAAGGITAEGEKPENAVFHKFLVVLLISGRNVEKLVGHRVLVVKDRHGWKR